MKKRWILIADGSRAKILEKYNNTLHNIELTYHSEEVSFEKDKGHHRPGIVTPSVVHAKHSFPPHEEWGIFERHEFAIKIATILNQNNDKFDELVLIAPPKVLGDLRKYLNKHSLDKLINEINKDYTHTPIKEIENIL